MAGLFSTSHSPGRIGAVAGLLLGLLAWAAAGLAGGYLQVSGPCRLELPRDHGPHPGYRTEWWYWTGNLRGPGGEAFGVQLTFFRFRMRPPGVGGPRPERPSAWRTEQLFLAHAAVTDVSGGRHRQAERAARPVLDLAGVRPLHDGVRVFLRDWYGEIGSGGHRIRAGGDGFAFDLALAPLKPPVFHGDGGYSRKGPRPDQASCYYSLTRLEAAGNLAVGGKTRPVEGLAWMDHEFSTAPLAPGIVGWDWFSLQLDDGSELMVYRLRRTDGSADPASSGTWVAPDGRAVHLAREEIRLQPAGTWKSPATGAVYPVRWRLAVPGYGIDLDISPALPDQEMRTPRSTGVTYWEGSVRAEGSAGGRPATGAGYVELTGYDRPFDAPM